MRIKQGIPVYTADDKHIGTVERVVFDPQNQRLTHLVVRRDYLAAENLIIAVALVGAATEDRITLMIPEKHVSRLAKFEENDYLAVPSSEVGDEPGAGFARPLYWYPQTGGWIARDMVPFDKNVQVVSADNKAVGTIDQIIVDHWSKQPSHLVIMRGQVLKDRKVIPVSWASSITKESIRLAISASLLDKVRPYYDTALV
jgi:uncharacterized protein YrrD